MPWKSEGPTCSNSPQSSGNEPIWSLATQWRCLGRPPRRKVQWFQATETTPDSSSLLGPKDLSARHLVQDNEIRRYELDITHDLYDDMKGTRIYKTIWGMMATRLTLFCKTRFGHCCFQRFRIPTCLVLSKISRTKEEKKHYKPSLTINLHLRDWSICTWRPAMPNLLQHLAHLHLSTEWSQVLCKHQENGAMHFYSVPSVHIYFV